MMETAVFGGTFNPVHTEHVNVARAAVEELGIKRLIITPTNNPPHKTDAGVSFDDRVEMLKIAFRGFPVEVIISDLENTRCGKNYSSETLPLLREKYGDFYYIIGGDSLLSFESWHEPRKIAKNFKIVVFNRDGYPDATSKIEELNEKWGASISLMKYVGRDEESRDIRAKLDLRIYEKGLPDGVYDYIISHGLYNKFDKYLVRLPDYLTEKRLIHSKNTSFTAANLNYECGLGIDYDRVIIAGLLHDLGKKYDRDKLGAANFHIPADCVGSPVQHQFIGAEIAANDFGVTDVGILDAIRYHTTGKPCMTIFEKLIYSADMVSTERVYDGVNILRANLKNNFEKGFLDCLYYSYDFLIYNNKDIYPLTLEAIQFYKESK